MLESNCAGWTAPPLRLGRVMEAVAVSAGFAAITGTVSGCKFTVPESGAPAFGVIFESVFLERLASDSGAVGRFAFETSDPPGAIVSFFNLLSVLFALDADDGILLPSGW
jgi:hypothetical protein